MPKVRLNADPVGARLLKLLLELELGWLRRHTPARNIRQRACVTLRPVIL